MKIVLLKMNLEKQWQQLLTILQPPMWLMMRWLKLLATEMRTVGLSLKTRLNLLLMPLLNNLSQMKSLLVNGHLIGLHLAGSLKRGKDGLICHLKSVKKSYDEKKTTM